MKKRVFAVLLLIAAVFVHAADRYALSGNTLTDVVQWLAVYAACVGQYNVAYLGDYKSGNPDPENLYQPTDIREYMARMSGDRTKADTFFGICFDYAQAAYNEIKRNRNRYGGLGIKEWYMACTWRTTPGQIRLFDPVPNKGPDTIEPNGVPIKEQSRHNVQNHGNGPMNHAWLWVIANDGTIYWIDPTWTDDNGYVVWGVVRNGREEQVAPAARLCRVPPSGVSFASFSSGDAARNQGNYDQAIDDYNEAIRVEPNYPVIYNSRGLAYYKKGDYDRAIADYTRALTIDPNFADAYANRGAAYLAKGDYDRAIADCGEAIRLDANLDAAYASRGTAYLEKGDTDRAFADYNQAISLNPNNFRALGGRARVYLAKHDHRQALADVNQAIRLWGREAAWYVTRGEIFLDMNDPKQRARARQEFETALRLNPNVPRARELLRRAR
jgi:Tfp pilus assembly protein PilF